MNEVRTEATGLTELRHELNPRYQTIFYIAFLTTILYLVIVLWATL